MASFSTESLTKQHEHELKQLVKRSLFTPTRFILLLAVCILLGSIFFRAAEHDVGGQRGFMMAQRQLLQTGLPWAEEFLENQQELSEWLQSYGFGFEERSFDALSQMLATSAAVYTAQFGPDEEPGLLSRLYLSVHGGLLRIGFLLLVCWKFWIIGAVVAFRMGFQKPLPFGGRDILGQTGNGRVFYSGSRVSLDESTAEGAPAQQVTGLACPAAVPLAIAQTSAIATVLSKYGASSKTGLGLAAIVLAHGDRPACVATHDESELLQRYFAGATLLEETPALLERILALHQQYRSTAKDQDDFRISQPLELSLPKDLGQKPISLSEYLDTLTLALHRSVTPSGRRSLAAMEPQTIAVIVLALEAGKSMAYAFEGGRWIRRSNFPQLSARAVLHSVASFSQEFDYGLRATIRRALIFGSRASVFAPVKFPVDLNPESRAARQWVELLLAAPHELMAVSDEVELLALVTEAHTAWERVFFDGATALDSEVTDEVYATPSNLLFMPVSKIVRLLRRVVSPATLDRLEELVAVIHQRQKMRILAKRSGPEEDGERPAVPSYERVFAPFTPSQIREISELHGVTLEDARDWSALRVVLNSFGWLGRRVWERSVPESSVVFAAFKTGIGAAGANELGFVGRSGMVPLRGTRLADLWGRYWQGRFHQVEGARMAETKRDFERILRGEDDIPVGDEESAVGAEGGVAAATPDTATPRTPAAPIVGGKV